MHTGSLQIVDNELGCQYNLGVLGEFGAPALLVVNRLTVCTIIKRIAVIDLSELFGQDRFYAPSPKPTH